MPPPQDLWARYSPLNARDSSTHAGGRMLVAVGDGDRELECESWFMATIASTQDRNFACT